MRKLTPQQRRIVDKIEERIDVKWDCARHMRDSMPGTSGAPLWNERAAAFLECLEIVREAKKGRL